MHMWMKSLILPISVAMLMVSTATCLEFGRHSLLQEGEGRKVMGLISMNVAAVVAGISAHIFQKLYRCFLFIFCLCHLFHLKDGA